MRHKRYHHWMMLCALILGPAAASAQAELTPDGGPVTVAEAVGDESVLFANNSVAAIDQDGNVGIAYTVRDGGDRQTLDVFGPDGASARHEAPALSFELLDTPTVSAAVQNLFVFGRPTETSQGSEDFAITGLRATNTANGQQNLAKADDINPVFDETIREVLEEEEIDCEDINIYSGLTVEIDPFIPESLAPLVPIPSIDEKEFIVNCDSEKLIEIKIFFFGAGATEEAIHETVVTGMVDLPDTGSTKNALPAATGNFANGRTRDSSVLAYFARTETAGEEIVTVVKLDEEFAVTDIVQIDDPLPKSFPPASIATCGFADFDHFWVTWSTDEGRAVAARFEGNAMQILDLGATDGAVDLACDRWGNAVVSWAAPFDNDSETSVLHTVALGSDGSTLADHQQTMDSLDEFGFRDHAKVSNDLNEAGEIVVAWSDGGGRVAFQRLKLSGHFKIDGTLSGSHYSPAFSGEGFIFDIVELQGTPTLVVYYFTYNDNGSGDPTWLVGQGPIVDNRAVAEMITGAGATFGNDFDPENVTRKAAGTVTATFLSCGLVLVEADSNRFGQQAYIAGPLTGRPLEVDGQCGTGPDGTAQVDASRGGSLYTPSRSGEGFIFDIVRVNGVPTLVAYYFTYQPDGSGKPAWMVGQGPIEGDSATLTMTIAEGASFGPDFDPADVVRTEWGEITVTFQTCENVLVEYDGMWGEGQFNVGPLTPPLIGATGLCAP